MTHTENKLNWCLKKAEKEGISIAGSKKSRQTHIRQTTTSKKLNTTS